MAKPDTATKTNHHHLAAWGTFEELLLACAVKRHGLQAWDSVAMELQSRTSLPPPFTSPHHCELKYRDLRRRFSSLQAATTAASEGDSGDKVDSIPWLEDLRKLRVAELRQGIQQSDNSIMSLQTKVKELTEEREESLREDQTSQQEPDLPVESKEKRSEYDNAASGGQPLASVTDKAASAAAKSSAEEESDRENRSVNGSNSTGAKSEKTGPEAEPKAEDEEDEPARPFSGSDKMDRVSNESRPEGMDSFNGSSEPNRRRTLEESEEPPESKENSSDVQSSASLTKKKRRGKGRRRVDEISVSGRGGESPVTVTDNAPPAANLAEAKPQPLVDILKMIRAHDNSSLFERRPSVQEKDKYKCIVRQHMDLETIHSRLQKGSYSTCLFSFYRDLLLLFCNAVVFYPKSSPESTAARELHRLVSNQIQKNPAPTRTAEPEPASKPDSLLAKPAPIVVCRKRSSIAVSPAETKPPVKSSTSSLDDVIKIKEKSVTGARSLRRSNTNVKNNNSSGGKKPATSEPVENPDPKKVDGSGSRSRSGKKRSAADFLKRMKNNSPAGKSKEAAVPADSKVSGGNGGNDQKKKTTGKVTSEKVSGDGKNTTKEESGSPSKRSVGRPPKKVGGGGDSVAAGSKRGRDSATKEVAASPATTPATTPAAIKRPRKRTRR